MQVEWLREAIMRTFGRAVVVSVAMASALMAVDGCARAEPLAATEATSVAGPYAPGQGYADEFERYGRGWPGHAWNAPRAWGGDWWPPRYAPQQQWRPRATRPYWAGPRWRSGQRPFARNNRDRGYPDQRHGDRYGQGYGQAPPYSNRRQYQRPYGYADWQWAQRY